MGINGFKNLSDFSLVTELFKRRSVTVTVESRGAIPKT